jgi:tubulin-folding cofactor B
MSTKAPFISKEDVTMLRDYVMAPSGQQRAETTVLLHVTHSNLQAKFYELRLDMHVSSGKAVQIVARKTNHPSQQAAHLPSTQMTIEALKVKLSFHCGTNPSCMMLQMLDDQGNMVANLVEDQRKLGYYSPYDGCA